jgi:FemAB-related protein (PEP-CTERM system-associated)
MLRAGDLAPPRAAAAADSEQRVLGVLPVVHLRHAIFGNGLVSMPFLDGGGILADGREAEESLLAEVVRLGERVGARYVELRHERALESCRGTSLHGLARPPSSRPLRVVTKSHKVRMLLRLPNSPEMLLKSFKSKLRSQVNKPLKEGFTTRVGGLELLKDFYEVFLVNMRDLGSPVHSVKLMQHALIAFAEHARIIVVYRSTEPVAGALVIGFGNVLRNLWASSLRKYASLGPNMLLYLRMLEYACDHGYGLFDFGRSSPGEGTYRFKEQWGAVPEPLYWHYLSLDGREPGPEDAGKARFETATRCWRRLPLIVTRIIGPSIRKHISL